MNKVNLVKLTGYLFSLLLISSLLSCDTTGNVPIRSEGYLDEPSVNITIIGPADVGTILSGQEISFTEGDTVLDILLKISSNNNFFVDYSGNGATAYVIGIDNIYEYDYGVRSGWIAKINGADLTKSSGATVVNKGDAIKWVYLEDFLEDNK